METKKIENLIDECYESNKQIANANNGPIMKSRALREVQKHFENELAKYEIESKAINKIYTAVCYSDEQKIEQIKKDIEKYFSLN